MPSKAEIQVDALQTAAELVADYTGVPVDAVFIVINPTGEAGKMRLLQTTPSRIHIVPQPLPPLAATRMPAQVRPFAKPDVPTVTGPIVSEAKRQLLLLILRRQYMVQGNGLTPAGMAKAMADAGFAHLGQNDDLCRTTTRDFLETPIPNGAPNDRTMLQKNGDFVLYRLHDDTVIRNVSDDALDVLEYLWKVKPPKASTMTTMFGHEMTVALRDYGLITAYIPINVKPGRPGAVLASMTAQGLETLLAHRPALLLAQSWWYKSDLTPDQGIDLLLDVGVILGRHEGPVAVNVVLAELRDRAKYAHLHRAQFDAWVHGQIKAERLVLTGHHIARV
jgi:hypothetical protein